MLVPGEHISLLYSKWLLYQAAGSCLFSRCFLQAGRSLNTQHKVHGKGRELFVFIPNIQLLCGQAGLLKGVFRQRRKLH